MTKGLRKDFRREVKHSFSRFLSILLISALGVAFFAGIRSASPAMLASADATFDSDNLADIRVIGTLGLTDNDVATLLSLEGVQAAEGIYTGDFLCETENNTVVAKVTSMTNQVSLVKVKEGRYPEKYNECIADREFLAASGFQIGDTVRLKTGTEAKVSDTLADDEFTIVGVGETSYYLNSERGTAAIGDGTADGLLVIPKEAFTAEVYSEIHVTMMGAAQMNCFSKDYDKVLSAVKTNIETVENARCEARLAEFRADADKKLNQAKYEFQEKKDKALSDLGDAYQTLLTKEAELENGQLQIEQQRQQIEELRALFDSGDQSVENGKAQIAEARATIDDLERQKKAIEDQIATDEAKIAQMQKELQEDAPYISDEEYYQRSMEIIRATATVEYYKNQLPAIEQSIADVNERVTTAEQFIEDYPAAAAAARIKIAEGEAKLEEAEKEIQDGEIALERAKEDYELAAEDTEAEINAAQEKLDKSEDEINNVKLPKWYILDRTSIPSYATYKNDAQSIAAVGTVFPIIFFLVAALVSLTTMTRMVEEERTQIGTLKALGYKKSAITAKFVWYALLSTLLGSIVGVALGESLLPIVIIRTYRTVYMHLTQTVVQPHILNAVAATVLALLATVGGAVAASARVLSESPAALMRPEAPKIGKRTFVEDIDFIWMRLNFAQKAACRNLFRYKKRLFMTILGVAGCMALLLAGFGIRDSVEMLPEKQFDRIFSYQGTVGADTSLSRAERRQLLSKVASVEGVTEYLQTKSIVTYAETEKGDTSAYLIVPQDTVKLGEYVHLREARFPHDDVALTDDGILITEKFAKTLGVSAGDMITIKEDETAEPVGDVRVAGVVENYLSSYIYMTPNIYKALYGETASLNAALIKVDPSADTNAVAEDLLDINGVTSVSMNATTQAQVNSMLGNLNVIIVLMILAAGLLAFIVLYNLNNINITERRRELATLKVLGFYPGELAAYVYRENVILTLFGTVLGIGLGFVLHWFVMQTVETETVMFGAEMRFTSYLFSVLLTVLFAVLVNALMYFRLKKIDMIESLKSVE
ncbi:MAG: FtsX-like permease family protein [Clostridia bacterium]|nr:FtsX-like permease family protein [Clostridia bacterium]